MMSKRSKSIVLLIVFLASMMIGAPALGQGIILDETFDDPDLPGWGPAEGAMVDQGVLHIEPHAHISYPAVWGDLTLSLRFMPLEPTTIVIGYSASDSGTYLLVVEYASLTLQEERNGMLVELTSVDTTPFAPNAWVEMEIELQGTTHRISRHGQSLLTIETADLLPPGGISIEVLGPAAADFDDVRVDPSSSDAEADVPAEILSLDDLAWVRTGGPLGGLGYDVRMRPDNPDIMFVTDAWAGVFKSLDGGLTWFPSNQGITTRTGESGDAIPIFCLTIDPHDPDIVWVGTQNTRGIFKSVDGGETWTEMTGGVIEREGITFRGITVDPRSSDIVYAAAEISSWTWAGRQMQGREFDRTQGVVYKTTDGGENWQAVWRGENLARYIWINPENPDIVYVSTGIFDREAANSDPQARIPGGEGVVKSTDGGETWQRVNSGLDNWYVGSLFMHPENPEILLAGTGNNQYYDDQGVYLTTDGGASWRHVLNEDNINAVEFSTSEPNIAYAASSNAVYRSDDSGVTWEKIGDGGHDGWGSPSVRAGFPIDFQADPRDPNRLFANNYGGGNFLSSDGGRTWTIASTGYTGAQVRAIAADPIEPGHVYAAARSGMFVSHDGGSLWLGAAPSPVKVLEWNAVAVDPHDGQHVLAANNWQSSIVQSHDGGLTWAVMQPQLGERLGWRVIAFAPSDSSIVYAGTGAYFSAGTFDDRMDAQGVYRSTDGGQSWSQINDDVSQIAHVAAIAIDPHDPEVIYLATTNLGVLKTTNGGDNWSQIRQGLPNNARALSVAIDPSDRSTVFAGLSSGGLYRSRDAGESWRSVPAGMNPEARISSIVFVPTDPSLMFISDRFSGVYHSRDGGGTWARINQGLTTRAVNALAISSDGLHLYAATEGGGTFRLDLTGQPPIETLPEEETTPEPTAEQPTVNPTDAAPDTQEPTARATESSQESPAPCLGGLLPLILLGTALSGFRNRKEPER